MSAEHSIQNDIMLACGSDPSVRLFRNNTGTGWVGEVIKQDAGIVILRNPRPLHSGLCKGSSDIIGFKSVTITPEMVGQTLAVFTGMEVKTPRGKATPEQETFIKIVNRFGGIAGVVRSTDDARSLINSR